MTVEQDRYSSIINEQGTTITYRQSNEEPFNAVSQTRELTYTDFVIKGHFRKFSQKEITGLVKDGDRQLRIAASALTFTPKTNDMIEITGGEKFNIVTVDTRTTNGVDTMHICIARGYIT